MKKEFAKMDAGLLHLTNKKMLLRVIQQRDQISRSELTRITGLTPPTVTRIVSELVETDELVEYVGKDSSNGGRPSVIIRFKEKGNYIIGIDLGATYIRGCLVDLKANFVSEIQISTEIEKGFRSIIQKVIHTIQRLEDRIEEGAKLWGVGIGVAGLVNRDTGIIENSPDFGWSNIDLNKELKNVLDVPFYYDNSTRLMALGELSLGNKRDLKNFVVINMGYGIASGLVIEGNLVKGNNGFAGEFGHISVDTRSKVKCKCGMHGCLEALASGHRISELGKELLANNASKILKELSDDNPALVTAELVARAAQKGDKECVAIYEEITDYLCKGIGIISNLVNPEIIYIGGGISLNGPFFFDLIKKRVNNYLLEPNQRMPILRTTFGEHATSIGAVSLVLQKVMDLELTEKVISYNEKQA